MIVVMLVQWAQKYAAKLLGSLGDRWIHTKEVAQQANRASRILPEEERDLLVAAAWLHDVGYAPQAERIGFHPLDGALHLKELGVDDRLCSLVAHHSAARFEAEERTLMGELDEFEEERGPVMDALTYADMTTGPTGQRVEFDERMKEILSRYNREDPVALVMSERAQPALRAAVDRTKSRMSAKVNQPI